MAEITDEAGEAITDEDGQPIWDEAGALGNPAGSITPTGSNSKIIAFKRNATGEL